jgi:hypothetical protein
MTARLEYHNSKLIKRYDDVYLKIQSKVLYIAIEEPNLIELHFISVT